jgi:hypothetical protein
VRRLLSARESFRVGSGGAARRFLGTYGWHGSCSPRPQRSEAGSRTDRPHFLRSPPLPRSETVPPTRDIASLRPPFSLPAAAFPVPWCTRPPRRRLPWSTRGRRRGVATQRAGRMVGGADHPSAPAARRRAMRSAS